jgi:branched-chain amino acid transport system permease protein
MTARIHPLLFVLPLAAVLAALAALLPPFRLFLVGQLAVVIVVTSAMTLLMGAAGLLSLASAASMAMGAYGVLLITGALQLPFPLAAVLTVMIGGGVGVLLGLVALRLTGFHLAIITLGFLQVLLVLLKRGGSLTGGGYGLVVPPLQVTGLGTLTASHISVAAVFIMVLTVAACSAAIQSRVGRAWLALRDNEPAARMQGIDVSRMKIIAFAFASAVISMAGILHVLLLGVANPSAYVVDVSIFHITLVVVGGTTGSMTGAVIAPVILYFLPEIFHALGEWRDFFYATVLLLTLLFMPHGIGPTLTAQIRRLWAARSAVS